MSEEHMSDSKFSRLFIIMILAMIGLTFLTVVIAAFASSSVDEKLTASQIEENQLSIAEAMAPVGSLATSDSVNNQVAAAAPAAEEKPLSGKEAYASCAACHASGVAGAPTVGDKALWKDRISQGIDTLYKHAVEGFQGSAGYMPAKGGNMSLSDASVKAAVDYMVEQSK